MRKLPEMTPDQIAELLATLAAEGRKDPRSAQVIQHAALAKGQGATDADCPFDDPTARERWLWIIKAAPAREKPPERDVSAAGGGDDPPPHQWWMDL